MSERRTPKPSPLVGEGAEQAKLAPSQASLRSEAGEGAFAGAIAPVSRARALRSRMTDAERKLWYALRDRRFASYKFRRQVPIGPFIADFICYDARVVIEVDGGQHAESICDTRRDQWFTAHGFAVRRFWNNDVLKNLEGVLLSLLGTLHARTPHPGRAERGRPSPTRGEGDGARDAAAGNNEGEHRQRSRP
jgi:very-short-patch-repair endonuclease